MVRSAISKRLGIPFEELDFAKTEFGKPYLVNDLKTHFNLSHSGDFVVVCIDETNVGVDIERIDNLPVEGIVDMFSQNEIDFIKSDGSTFDLERFFRVWTLKESFLKYMGKGLSLDLKTIEFYITKSKIAHVIDSDLLAYDKNFYFNQLELTNDYIISVCREYKTKEKLQEFYFNGECDEEYLFE
nr:4'-phosphopantetheinyl transferase superfamily protein [Exiguobacterium sp. s189]